jgi:hypothetical protein
MRRKGDQHQQLAYKRDGRDVHPDENDLPLLPFDVHRLRFVRHAPCFLVRRQGRRDTGQYRRKALTID